MLFFLSIPFFAMNDHDFSLLQDQVEKSSFHSDKLAVIQLSAQHNTFTCDQVAQLIKSLPFDGDQIEALKILAPRIEDPERSFTILDAFSFQSSREEARDIINARAPKQSLEQKKKQEEEALKRKREAEKERKRKERLERNITYEEGPSLRWVGHCKTKRGECINFHPRLFYPISNTRRHKHFFYHELLLEVTGPGVLDVSIELGKKYSCRQQRTKRGSSIQNSTHKIPLQSGTQVVDIGALISNWKREYVNVEVKKGVFGSSVHLEKWKRCK